MRGLGLHNAWLKGAVILGGTAAYPPEIPWVDGSKVGRTCPEQGCHTTVFGWSATQADDMLTAHRKRSHD